MAFLDIIGVYQVLRQTPVLRGIDLSVEQHQVVCLIGASGSGKSTLLRCVNGLEPIEAGDIWLDGDVVSGRASTWTGCAGTSASSSRASTCSRTCPCSTTSPWRRSRSAAPPGTEARDRGLELLGRVGLADKADSYPDQLSGGQQQRVAIVRAMAMEPRVLLLDEITSALDPELVAEVLDIVRELAADGLTMLLATHEMSFASEVADTVCFLDQGVILEQGPPEQIFRAPEQERTRAFLDRVIRAGRL